jgi:hypothetical protein
VSSRANRRRVRIGEKNRTKLLKTKIEPDAVPDLDGAETVPTKVLAVVPEPKPLRPLADIAAPLLLEIRIPVPRRHKEGACWDIGAAPVVDNVNELFDATLAALGVSTAPYVWRIFEWVGQHTRAPKILLQLSFGLWWAIPALIAGAVMLIESARQAGATGWLVQDK